MMARLESWWEYIRWTRTQLEPAREWHARIKFDLAHHITYVSWRVASPLWKLGIPLIWGPIGGGEVFPPSMRSVLSPAANRFETVRQIANVFGKASPAIRMCTRKSAHIFAGNVETRDLLVDLGSQDDQVSILPGTFFNAEHASRFQPGEKSREGEPVRIFCGGNLEGRKGVALALRALGIARKMGLNYHYTIGGTGPEAAYLQKLSVELGIEDRVDFTNGFSGLAYSAKLAETDIYLLPSLRESAGLTLMEAMLSGCIPVVADCGGPATIVNVECGFKVKPISPDHMIGEIAKILLQLANDPDRRKKMGDAARHRITEYYSADAWLEKVEEIYRKALLE